MSYIVNKSNGDIASIVNDFKKEIIGGLNILGYGYINFGEEIAENFVQISENFRSDNPPYSYLSGQIWLDTNTSRSQFPVLRIAVNDSESFDESTLTQNFVANDWVGLFAIDAENMRAGLIFNNQPLFPDINPVANTLVIRGPDGRVPMSSLPESIGNASTVERLSPGANINGVLFTGQNNITINSGQIPESGNLYYTDSRVRNALSGGRYISIDSTSGLISFTGPEPAEATQGPQGPAGPQGPQGPQGIQGPQGLQGDAADIIISSNYNPDGGYVVYNGGFTVQWGRFRQSITSERTVSASYPLAFTQVMQVVATPVVDFFRVRANLWIQIAGNPGNSGFTVGTQSDDGDNTALEGFSWVAYGRITTTNPVPPTSDPGTTTPPGDGGGGGGGGGGGTVEVNQN